MSTQRQVVAAMTTDHRVIRYAMFMCVALAVTLAALAGALPLQAAVFERVSIASDGTEANSFSGELALSADERYVAFISHASNLVSGDTNGVQDAFVHDRHDGVTQRVSVATDGTQADDHAFYISISGDGRFVAFSSRASTLVAGDTNGDVDIFVHDRQTGETERVSVAADGTQGDGPSNQPAISADGRFVAFHSRATNLVPGDTNNETDVFVHDRQSGETERVSISSGGIEGNDQSFAPSISADGRLVAFYTSATNFIASDVNGQNFDVYVHDRQSGETELAGVSSDGTQADTYTYQASITADGRYVVFSSAATNLVVGDTNGHDDIFVHDRQTGETQRVSLTSEGVQANHLSDQPAISADGRYVAFRSFATNLGSTSDATPFRYDVFVHDRQTEQTAKVSVAADGTQGNEDSALPALGTTGEIVAFLSFSDNLVVGDTNGQWDVFVALSPLFVPPTPLDLLEELESAVVELDTASGTAQSLSGRLDAVRNTITDDNPNNDGAAENALHSFIDTVMQYETQGRLSEAQAAELVTLAEALLNLL